MTTTEVMHELKALGNEQTKKTWLRHGAKEPIFGVKIGDMKKRIVKRVKMDYQLALDLFATGNGDAMYFAGLIADDMKMTKKDLQRWVEQAEWGMISDFTVPWVASGSKFGHELAMEWIDSKKEHIAAAGWMTLGSLVATKEDSELDIAELKKLLKRVEKSIHDAPNRVRYPMNCFVIATGSAVAALTDLAIKTAEKIGTVECEMVGDCKVPPAADYIRMIQQRGTIGKKRKTAKC